MQPYRLVADKNGRERHLCQQDGCDEVAETQHRRHATEREYADLPDGLVPSDGVCHAAVFTCNDHELDPICGPEFHALPEPADPQAAACPKCAAEPGAPCVKADGRPRRAVHKSRVPAPAGTAGTRCDHVHRADCEGFGTCECKADDPVPERVPRPGDGLRP